MEVLSIILCIVDKIRREFSAGGVIMENRIKEYVEEIFAEFPESEQKTTVKAEVLHEALDSYHDFVMAGKKPQHAYERTIDAIDVEKLADRINAETENPKVVKTFEVPVFEKADVVAAKKKTAILQALALFLYINCLTPAFFLEGTSLITSVAPMGLFLCIAVATILLAYNKNTRLPRHNVIDLTEEEMAENHKKCRLLIIVGIVIIVLGFLSNFVLGSPIAVIMYGLGVGLIVYGTNLRFADVDDEDIAIAYKDWEKYQSPVRCKLRVLRCGLWMITLALYLILSIVTNLWYATWLLFPLAGMISNVLGSVLNKKGKFSVVLWSAGSVLIALVLVGAMFGASMDLGAVKINAGTVTYDNAEMYEVGSAEISEDVESMEINWTDGTVTVQAYEGSTVQLIEDENLAEGGKLRYYLDGKKLIIQYCESNLGISEEVPHNKNLVVNIPTAMAESLKDVAISSTASDLILKDFTAETLTIDKVSGDVQCDNLAVVLVSVNSVSADCTFAGSCESFTDDSTSGNVHFTALDNTWPKNISVNNMSGNVEIYLPAEMPGFLAAVSTVSSTFDTDFFVTEEKGGYSYGNAEANYMVNTVSGKVIINQIK